MPRTPSTRRGAFGDEISMPQTLVIFLFAAAAEIGGCFAFWMWLRRGASIWWLVPGLAALVLFAALLTRADADFAGRAYAAYGGIYIVSSLLWLWGIEGLRPSRWDLTGASLAVLGSVVILLGAGARS